MKPTVLAEIGSALSSNDQLVFADTIVGMEEAIEYARASTAVAMLALGVVTARLLRDKSPEVTIRLTEKLRQMIVQVHYIEGLKSDTQT